MFEAVQLDAGDRLNLLRVERIEHNNLVDPIDELRAEVLPYFGHHRLFDDDGLLSLHALNLVRAQVRRHHDYGVLEVHSASLAVGHATIIEHLEKDVENVRMRLLDFVEQNHRVWLAAHRFGQRATFVITDIARRRADHAGNRVLLHVLAHVDANQRVFGIEQELGKRLRQLCLANTRRAEKEK